MPVDTGRISHRDEMHRDHAWKRPCRAATTANITISTALNNGDTIDGITLATGDRVLVKDQSSTDENGIYVVGASPARDFDMDSSTEVLGTAVYVIGGTVNGGKLYRCSNTTFGTIGTDSMTFAEITGSGSSSLPWFVVTDYGAVNDGSTNDTSAINSAIAALNAVGFGVLYFPGGTGYSVNGALTTITAACTVLGDGGGFANPATQVIQLSSTAHTFTQDADGMTFRGIAGVRSGSTSSNGSFIRVTSGNRGSYEDLSAEAFYINIDFDDGYQWSMTGCLWSDGILYNARLRNIAVPDGGDWSISNTFFGSTVGSDAHVRYESGGGGKFANCKFNGATTIPVRAIDVYVDSGDDTSVLTIVGCSFENVSGDAIYIATNGTGIFGLIAISGCQFGLYSNNTGRAVKVVAASAGGAVAGGIFGVVIDGCVMRTDGTARAAIELTNTDRVTLGDIQLVENFTTRYTSSGDTNTTDTAASGGASISSCVAQRTSSVSISSASYAVPYNASDVYDPDGWHDPASNNTRLTCPSGIGGKAFAVAASMETDSGTAYQLAIRVNGSTLTTYDQVIAASYIGMTSGIVYLTDGDYIELLIIGQSGANAITTDIPMRFSVMG